MGCRQLAAQAQAVQALGSWQRTLKDVALGLLQHLKPQAYMHVLVHARVVVYKGPLVLRLDQKVVVDAKVAGVVNAARDDDAHELQVCQVLCHVIEREHAHCRLRDVGGVHRVVVGVCAVPALHFLRARMTALVAA
jgi:hypothetical protein